MAGDRSAVYKQYPETLAIPTGVTALIPQMPHQVGVILNWESGGSLQIQGSSHIKGTTYATAQSYLLGTTEVLNVSLSGPLYLVATGATCVARLIRLLGAGDQI
jgi:hypothetical protein